MSKVVNSLFKDNENLRTNSSIVGEFGEKAAVGFLARLGYSIVSVNFKVPVGRNRRGVAITGEIDIIAFDIDTLCFIEVKTRSSDKFNSPLAAINLRKQRQIIRTARVYRKVFNIHNINFRYDAVSIVLNGSKAPTIELSKGFWNEAKFNKKFWSGDF